MKTARTTFFTRDKNFYKTFFRLMLVVALQNLVAYSVNMLDNIMLGGYSQNALSGAATVNQIFFIVNQLALSIGNATFKNALHIFLFSGANMILIKLTSNNRTFVSIFHTYTTMINSSSILAVNVPTAAPLIPISGNPKCPKINV